MALQARSVGGCVSRPPAYHPTPRAVLPERMPCAVLKTRSVLCTLLPTCRTGLAYAIRRSHLEYTIPSAVFSYALCGTELAGAEPTAAAVDARCAATQLPQLRLKKSLERPQS
eukprot:3941379-Rhodomonas_salina.1